MFEDIITTQFKQLFKDAISALLEDGALTVPCTLIYGITQWTPCPNCVLNVATGKSSGIYLAGGPIPFYNGSCPVCFGEGRHAETEEEADVYLGVIWDFKKFINVGGNTLYQNGYIQTLSKIDTITKLKKAKEILVNTDIGDYVKHKFSRDSEPTPIGLGEDAFILTMWKQS